MKKLAFIAAISILMIGQAFAQTKQKKEIMNKVTLRQAHYALRQSHKAIVKCVRSLPFLLKKFLHLFLFLSNTKRITGDRKVQPVALVII